MSWIICRVSMSWRRSAVARRKNTSLWWVRHSCPAQAPKFRTLSFQFTPRTAPRAGQGWSGPDWLTIPVLKDDAHAASTARLLAAVHNPQGLHLGVHEGALLHTVARPQTVGEGSSTGPRRGRARGLGWGLTRLLPAGCWGQAGTAGGTGPPDRLPGACTSASAPWSGAWWSSGSSPLQSRSATSACSMLPPGGDSGRAAVAVSLSQPL